MFAGTSSSQVSWNNSVGIQRLPRREMEGRVLAGSCGAGGFLAGRWKGRCMPDPAAPAATSLGDGGAAASPEHGGEGAFAGSHSSGSEQVPRWPDRAESGAEVLVERRCGAGSGVAVDFL